MSLDAGEYGNGAYFHKSPEDALRFAIMPTIGFFNRPPQRHTAPIQHHRPAHNGSFPGAFNQGFDPFYTDSIGNGQLMLIQARVVTGEWIQGSPYLRAASYENPLQQYDSVVDNVSNPSMYVIFNDAAVYPEYIIELQNHTDVTSFDPHINAYIYSCH